MMNVMVVVMMLNRADLVLGLIINYVNFGRYFSTCSIFIGQCLQWLLGRSLDLRTWRSCLCVSILFLYSCLIIIFKYLCSCRLLPTGLLLLSLQGTAKAACITTLGSSSAKLVTWTWWSLVIHDWGDENLELSGQWRVGLEHLFDYIVHLLHTYAAEFVIFQSRYERFIDINWGLILIRVVS